jgi:hypothetical protein
MKARALPPDDISYNQEKKIKNKSQGKDNFNAREIW